MSSLAIATISFVCIFRGALLGMLFRPVLPERTMDLRPRASPIRFGTLAVTWPENGTGVARADTSENTPAIAVRAADQRGMSWTIGMRRFILAASRR
jgi:hypothetical protein